MLCTGPVRGEPTVHGIEPQGQHQQREGKVTFEGL